MNPVESRFWLMGFKNALCLLAEVGIAENERLLDTAQATAETETLLRMGERLLNDMRLESRGLARKALQ